MKKIRKLLFLSFVALLSFFIVACDNDDKPEIDEVKVTYNLGYNAADLEDEIIKKGEKASKPQTPNREDFEFLGWFNGEELYDFTKPVNEDLTLVAKWQEKELDLKLPTIQEVLTLLTKTKNDYISSSDIDIYLETEVKQEIAKLRLNYEINGFDLDIFKYFAEIDNETYEVYVKNNIQYLNFNGNKSQKSLDNKLSGNLISNYSFINITEDFYAVFSNDFFSSLFVLSEEEGLITLFWEKDESKFSGLDFDLFGLDDDISKINVKLNYLNSDVNQIESIIDSVNGEQMRFLLNFKANEKSTFEYPNDLDSYPLQ